MSKTNYYLDENGWNITTNNYGNCIRIPISCLTKRTRKIINTEEHNGKLPANDHNLTKQGRETRNRWITTIKTDKK